ncbi:MAG: DNA/RNA non-specific endonuclease [Clostridia bacterium]|nr:DNA/RNA non-specific endonuclease [Clostridia bacterium]
MNNKTAKLMSLILSLLLILTACKTSELTQLEYAEDCFVTINNNAPEFSDDEISTESFESYSELDSLGRCGAATACIGKDIMPIEERGAIGQVKPSGWQIAKYDIVDGKYLYNRCHLIGYQLTGENANEKNLITGTRSMNVDGMLPYENMVADYVEETGNHVMYRVTPIFEGDNLLANGVQMEALSVEDNGAGISFNVFVFNTQPGIEINYADGTSKLIDEQQDIAEEAEKKVSKSEPVTYILNTNTKKIHYPDCPSLKDTKKKNTETYNGTKEYLLENGYTSCSRCKP